MQSDQHHTPLSPTNNYNLAESQITSRPNLFSRSQNELVEAFEGIFPLLNPIERLHYVVLSTALPTVITTSGGIQSATLLSSYTELRSSGIEVDARERLDQISVVFLDTGDLFPETHAYINYLSTTLDLPIERYRHGLTPDEFKQNVTLLRDSGLSEGDAFDELTKVRPIRQIIEDLGVKVWISGIRRDQSLSRREIPFAEVKNGIIKVYPLADVTNQRAAQMLEERSLTRHPLAHLYRSIGNRQDTRPSSEGHEKSGRHHGEKEECGLHLGWIKHGKTLIYRGESLIPATKFPLVQNRIIPGA